MDGSKKLFLFVCLQLSIYMVDVAAVAPIELPVPVVADVTKDAPIELQAVADVSSTGHWVFIYGTDSPRYHVLFETNGVIYPPYDESTVVYITARGIVYYIRIDVYSDLKPKVDVHQDGKVKIQLQPNDPSESVRYRIIAKGIPSNSK